MKEVDWIMSHAWKGKKREGRVFSLWLTRLIFVATAKTRQPKPFTPTSRRQRSVSSVFLRLSSLQTLVMRINWVEGRSFFESHVSYSVTCFFLFLLFRLFLILQSLCTVYLSASWVFPLLSSLIFHRTSPLRQFIQASLFSSSVDVLSSFLASHPSLITECQALEAKQWRE